MIFVVLYFSDGIGIHCPPRTLVNGSVTIEDALEEFSIISRLPSNTKINYTYNGVNHTFDLFSPPHKLTNLAQHRKTQVSVHIAGQVADSPENAHCTFTVGKYM